MSLLGGDLVRLTFWFLLGSLVLGGCATGVSQSDEALDQVDSLVDEVVDQDAPVIEVIEPNYVAEQAEVFSDPWPTEFTRVDLINSAQSKMHPYFDDNLGADCEHQVHLFFEESDPIVDDIELIGDSIVRIFCADLTDDVWVVVGEYEFLKQIVAQNQLTSDEYGGVCGVERPPSIGCALYDTVWVQRVNVDDRKLRGLVAHEMFHIVQDSISPEPPSFRLPPGDPIRVPNWLTEGSAMFFEGSINDYLGTNRYVDFAADQYELRPGSQGTIDLRSLDEGWSGAVYNVGQFGTEYLVANSSFEQFMQIWRLRDEGIIFADAFYQAFDISIEEFYELTAEISILEFSG